LPNPGIATFSITTPSTTAKLDANRKAQAAFTVTNASIQPLRGRARVVPMDGAKPEWFTLDGDAERAFAANGTQQYTVQVSVPPTAPAGTYKFQLRVVGVANPDEQYGESQLVAFEVPQPVKKSTPLPMWIWIVAAIIALLILGGIALGLYLANRKAAATFDPASVNFANQALGVVSASKTVRITSSGPVDLHIKSVSITGEQYKEEFQRATDSCSGKTIAAGKSCTVDIVFKPGATGPRSASLLFIMDTEPGSKSIALKGQGVQPVASLSASQLTFTEHFSIFSTSAPPPQSVILTNTGTGDLTVTAVRIDGGPFTVQQTCTTKPIAPGLTCSVDVTYYYPGSGSFTNGLTITDNANPASQTVILKGSTVSP
jgi:hypothetical protein